MQSHLYQFLSTRYLIICATLVEQVLEWPPHGRPNFPTLGFAGFSGEMQFNAFQNILVIFDRNSKEVIIFSLSKPSL